MTADRIRFVGRDGLDTFHLAEFDGTAQPATCGSPLAVWLVDIADLADHESQSFCTDCFPDGFENSLMYEEVKDLGTYKRARAAVESQRMEGE